MFTQQSSQISRGNSAYAWLILRNPPSEKLTVKYPGISPNNDRKPKQNARHQIGSGNHKSNELGGGASLRQQNRAVYQHRGRHDVAQFINQSDVQQLLGVFLAELANRQTAGR